MSFVSEQLDSLAGDIAVEFKTEYALVQCPFHKDGQESHPSLMVNLENPKYAEGFFYCMSCGEKGSWDVLAEALSLELSTTGDKLRQGKFAIKPLSLKKPESQRFSSLDSPWDPKQEWRGISGQLLADLGAKLSFNTLTKTKQLTLPAKILGDEIGFISCALTKRSKEEGPSYFNSPGPWVKRAVFPFDYVLNLFNKERLTAPEVKLPIFLVEGPRDALNLLQHKLPALAILGSHNWSHSLIPLLAACVPSYYVVLMDGDEAGDKASQVIYNDLIKVLPKHLVKVCKLPRGKDPADLNSKISEWLKETYSTKI